MTNKIIQTILDNRWVQRFIIIIAIINVFRSMIQIRKEYKILKDIINSNDDFFKSIATLGFVPAKILPSLVSILPYEDGMTLEEIHETAQKTIIGVIMQYVKDENLFGIIKVDCSLKNQHVVTEIRPAQLSILFIDLFDLLISFLVTIVVSLLIYFIV